MRSLAPVFLLAVLASGGCRAARTADARGPTEGPPSVGVSTSRGQARCRPVAPGERTHRVCQRTPRRAPTSVPDTTAVPDTAIAR